MPIAIALRELVGEIDPEAVEVPRPGDRAATYGIGPKKMSEAYAYIMPQKDRVNLGFLYGVDLPDPDGLLEGTGKKLRHVKVYDMATAESPAIRALLEASLAERKAALGR